MKLRNRHEFGLLFAIVVVALLTTALDAQHNYWTNPNTSIVEITRQTTLLGIFSLGAAIVIISGGIDLSAGSMIAFGGTICGTLMLLLAPESMASAEPVGLGVILLSILGTLFVGFLVGTLHAWLITVVGLPPFVATLATLVGLRSFSRAIVASVSVSATNINFYDPQFLYLSDSVWIPAVLFLTLAAGTWILLTRTVTGRHLYALGGNEQAARLSGIQTDRLKWLAYCISAMLSALAGILYVSDQTGVTPQSLGRGYELNGIAAAVVGGCSLQGGIGTVPGTVLGALFLRMVLDGVAKIIKTDADVYEGLLVGVVVVVAVAFNQVRQAGRQRKSFFPGVMGLITILNLTLLAGALTAFIGPKLLKGQALVDAKFIALGTSVLTLVLLLAVRGFERRRAR